MTSRLVTAREVADRLVVSTETVLRWTRQGMVPAIRLPGGAIRFREDEVERCLEEWTTSSAAPDAAPPRLRPTAPTTNDEED